MVSFHSMPGLSGPCCISTLPFDRLLIHRSLFLTHDLSICYKWTSNGASGVTVNLGPNHQRKRREAYRLESCWLLNCQFYSLLIIPAILDFSKFASSA